MTKDKVFVYGTLKEGHPNHRYLQGLTKKNGVAFGIELHCGPGFPYAVRGERATLGEIYEVDSKILESLDYLEGVPTHYQREKTLINTANENIECWIYLSPNHANKYPVIESGLWTGRR